MDKKNFFLRFYKFINYLPFNNKKKGKIKIVNKGSILKGCSFISIGKNNNIKFSKGGFFNNCCFIIYGNDNTICIGKNGRGYKAEFYIEDSNNIILVGDNTSFCGTIHLAAIEGTKIAIGSNCLFSSDIVFRTGDSHSILDLEGNRINPSKNIEIKDHCWIGHKVIVTKGVTIQENSVVGTGAIVTKPFEESNVVIAGIPAKIQKRDINWDINRISVFTNTANGERKLHISHDDINTDRK